MIDVSKEIAKELALYTQEVTEGLEQVQKAVGKDAVKMVKRLSPVRTGRYSKGWRLKRTANGYVVHNATDYQLTHLLEKGHPKVNGGRVAGIPHIGPTEDWAVDEYVKRTEELIRG